MHVQTFAIASPIHPPQPPDRIRHVPTELLVRPDLKSDESPSCATLISSLRSFLCCIQGSRFRSWMFVIPALTIVAFGSSGTPRAPLRRTFKLYPEVARWS